jgi:hypothetical protein
MRKGTVTEALTGDRIALARRLGDEGSLVPEASWIFKIHRIVLYRAVKI